MRFALTKRIYVNGLNIDTLLKILLQKNAKIFHAKRLSHSEIEFSVEEKTFKKLLSEGVFKCYNIIERNESSVQHIVLNMTKRIGILIGVLISFISCFCFSKMIWKIDICVSAESANIEKLIQNDIENILKENNIMVGMKISDFNRKKTENYIFSKIENVGTINITRSGTRISIIVSSAVQSPERTGQIVSEYDCVIESISVGKGRAIVKAGDSVFKGQTLVEPAEDGKCVATILTKVWFQSTASQSVNKTTFEKTGKKFIAVNFVVAGKMLGKIYKKCEFENYELKQKVTNISQGMFIPITKIETTFHETRACENTLSEEEAYKIAKQKADKHVIIQINDEAKVNSKKYFKRVDGDFVFCDCFVETEIYL